MYEASRFVPMKEGTGRCRVTSVSYEWDLSNYSPFQPRWLISNLHGQKRSGLRVSFGCAEKEIDEIVTELWNPSRGVGQY